MLDRALIGERIAMLRKKAGLSQSALAEKLDAMKRSMEEKGLAKDAALAEKLA